jgi:hypothetical protein
MNKVTLISLFLVSSILLIINLFEFNLKTNGFFYYLEILFDIFVIIYATNQYLKFKKKAEEVK